MEKLWCWRCRMKVAMLDEEEYTVADDLYGKLVRNITASSGEERNRELLDYYFTVTGETATNPNAVMHHRIALYGPPCENCGKPHRTDKASFCAACGHKQENL